MPIRVVRAMDGAAEAGAEPTGHVRFKRGLAGDLCRSAQPGDSGHHRLGPADIHLLHGRKMVREQISHKTMMAQGTIVGGSFNPAAQRAKFLGQMSQFIPGLCSEEDRTRLGTLAGVAQPICPKKQGGYTDTASYQANRCIYRCHLESMTKRSDETQLLPRPETGEQSGALANYPEEELDLIRSDTTVDGKRAAQEWVKRGAAGYHHKLARPGGGGDQGSRKGQ